MIDILTPHNPANEPKITNNQAFMVVAGDWTIQSSTQSENSPEFVSIRTKH